MSDCASIDPYVTRYVDGELNPTDRGLVDVHTRVCPPCRSRLEAERAVHELLATQQPQLQEQRAPLDLRARCAAAARPVRPAPAWRARLAPLALAATLILAVGGAVVHYLTQASVQVMAAELTADHLKCFVMNAMLGTRHDAETVEQRMAEQFGWPAHLPDRPEQVGLQLVGARPCLYGEGRVAHIMYRRADGRPVSVFMLPEKSRPQQLLGVLGHEAAIWSEGERTFVLIAQEPRAEMQRIAEFVHAGLR